jgi:hypothetical protein
VTIALSTAASPLIAQEQPAKPAPAKIASPVKDAAATPEPAPVPHRRRAQARLDVLMIAVSEERVLPLLSQLRDPATVDAAQATLLKWVAEKSARLLDWPEVTVHSGDDRSVAETIDEYRAPNDYDEPSRICGLSASTEKPPPLSPAESALGLLRMTGLIAPASFLTRNTGASLEASVEISPDTKTANVYLWPTYIVSLPEKEYAVARPEKGAPITVRAPQFLTVKTIFGGNLRDGERRMIYFHKAASLGGEVIVFIAGVQLIPPASAR